MPDSNIDRILGQLIQGQKSLEKNFDKFTDLFNDREDRAALYRQEVRTQLNGIDDKIDPVKNEVQTLALDVKAHAAALSSIDIRLTSIEDTRNEIVNAARVGRWIIRVFWLIGASLAIFFFDNIKSITKVIMFWK